jgi:hypothetical protein
MWDKSTNVRFAVSRFGKARLSVANFNNRAPSAEHTRLATYERHRVYFVTFVLNSLGDSGTQCLLI